MSVQALNVAHAKSVQGLLATVKSDSSEEVICTKTIVLYRIKEWNNHQPRVEILDPHGFGYDKLYRITDLIVRRVFGKMT